MPWNAPSEIKHDNRMTAPPTREPIKDLNFSVGYSFFLNISSTPRTAFSVS